MAKFNHGISIDIDDQVNLYNSKHEDDEEVKINDMKDYQEKVSLKMTLLGALLFIYIEKDYDLASKQESYNYHLIARDMLFHSLKQIHIENRNDRENRWKEAILEFEANINALPPSLETSWTFSMAIFYVGTIYTTIGYGNIACATTTGRIVSIIYAFIGIPIFLIILNNLNEFLLKKIKMISILFENNIFYYSIKFGLLKLEGEKKIKYYKKLKKEKNVDNLIENELIDLSKVNDNTSDTCIKINIEENEKNFVHNPPILTGVLITLIWIFLSAGLFCLWEDWTYGSSTYFIFISLLTIGFGDIYPVHRPELFCWAFGAVIIGLSLVTVCISLCQEKIELLYKSFLDKLLDDYIKALESGDPNAVKDAMSAFGGKAKFIMPLISKSKGLKMMEQLKSDAKEKGIDLPPSISSVNPETGRPNFCETTKDKLDDLIKNEKINAEKVSSIIKNKIDEDKKKINFENVKNSQIQTDESLLDEYIKNVGKLKNYDITSQMSSIINDDIIQIENKKINNFNDVSSLKIPTTNTSNQTDIILLKDCGIQPDVSYIVKHFHIKNNQFENILNDDKLKCNNISSSNENICVNFMKDTALDPIDILTNINTSTQTKEIAIRSRRSQTRLTGIVKARKNIKIHSISMEHDIHNQKNRYKNKKINKSGMTKKEKNHLKNFLLNIRNNDKQNFDDDVNKPIDKIDILTTRDEKILLIKELENYRSKNNIYKIVHDKSDNYDYELKSNITQQKLPNNTSLDSDNFIIKNAKLCKEKNLQSLPLISLGNNLIDSNKNLPVTNDKKMTSIGISMSGEKEKNINLLPNNQDKYSKIEQSPNIINLIDSQINSNQKNIQVNGKTSIPQNNKEDCPEKEVSLDGKKYEEVTINIELTKKLKNEDLKLITTKEKDYISKLTENTNLIFSDSSDSEEHDIDGKKLHDIIKMHDRFSSEDDNISIEELFTDTWVQTDGEFGKPKLPLKDNTSQYDKTIDQSYFIEKNSQTVDKSFVNNDSQTIINELNDTESQTTINMDNIYIKEDSDDLDKNIQIQDVAVQTYRDYGNFTSQYNYEIPKMDSQTQYISNSSEFGSQYIYKPETMSKESQIKAEFVDFSNQYAFIPLTVDSEVQVSCKKKENNTQTRIKFYENQATQFNLEKINKETQVGFDEGIISRNISLKNLIIREKECLKEGVEDISKMLFKKKYEESVPSTTKFTLFEEDSNSLLKSKNWKSGFLNKEENDSIISSCHTSQKDINKKNLKKDYIESEITVQHYNKKLEFTNYGDDVTHNTSKDELYTEEGDFESLISDGETESNSEKKSDQLVDVGIQTGVLARVQHIYGEGRKHSGTSDSVPPEFQKVSLKRLHAIDDKGVYRSIDITPPASPSSISVKRKLSLKKDRSSKIYNDNLKNQIKESTVPSLIRSFNTFEEEEESSPSGKLNPPKK